MQDFDVCSYDLRKHGESYERENNRDAKGLSLEYLADDVVQLVGLLNGRYGKDSSWNHPLLVGHSLGCNIALEVGRKYPTLPSGFVLIDGGYIDLQNCFDGNWESCEHTCRPPDLSIPFNDFVSTVRSFCPLFSHLGLNGMMENFYLHAESNCYKLKVSPDLYMEAIKDLWGCRPCERYCGQNFSSCKLMILPSGREAFFSKDKEADIQRLISALRDSNNGEDADRVRVWWFEDNNHDVHSENAFGCARAIVENVDFFSW